MPTQSTLITIILGASIGALVFAVGLARWVLARPTGTPDMRRISDAIQEGAEAYLARQYKTISVLAVLVAILLAFGYGVLRTSAPGDPVSNRTALAIYITLSFLLGALSSGIAGFMGMWVSIRANIRVAAAATTSLHAALQTALRGGAVSGLFTVAMSLLGVGGSLRFPMLAPAGADAARGQRDSFSSSASASAPRCWRCLCVSAAASTPRPRTSARTWWARSKLEFRRTIRATRR
jgi:K(+)-stimulated pyrophosphate-energized sodium pump